MWRSNARALLIRSSIPKAHSNSIKPNQVPFKIPTLMPSPSSYSSSTWFFQQIPRFFSHNSNPNDENTVDESYNVNGDSENPSFIDKESPTPWNFATRDVGTDKNGVFDYNPVFVSQESDASLRGFSDGVEKDDSGDAKVTGLNDKDSSTPWDFETSDVGSDKDGVFDDASLMGLNDGIEKDDSFGEYPCSVSQENGNGDHQLGSLVSEELDEETLADPPKVDIEQVEKVLSVLQSNLDRSLESTLDNMDLNVSEEFVARVIQTPYILGENLIRFFKWALKKPDFSVSNRIVDLLVRAVSVGRRKKEAYSLWDLVKEIGEKESGVVSTEILNELICLFWKLGKGKAGLEVFNEFEGFAIKPNADTYYLTIEALSGRSMFEDAWSVCEKMLNSGSLPDSEKIGKIITCLCKGSKGKDAYLVYLTAKENEKYPPKSAVNFLIGSLCRDDETVRIAAELLADFSGESRKYAIKPFSSVVRGLCRIKDVEEAKKLLHKMIESGPPPGNAVFNSVINGLSKAGEMEEAIAFMRVMESRGLRPDVYTYSVIMSGFAKGGQMEDALRIFSEAKKKHSKLSPVTYHILIRGYCKMEEFDKALKCLSEMKESGGVRPNVDEYNKMVQSLCLKALDWRKAEELHEEMKENGLYLNGITRGLIKAVKDLEEDELQAGLAEEELQAGSVSVEA